VYKDTPCPSHISRPPRAESATPAEHSGALRAYVPVLHPHCDPVTAGLAPDARAGQEGACTDFQAAYLKETT